MFENILIIICRYPYHGNFIVDTDNQPDYYGKYAGRTTSSLSVIDLENQVSNSNHDIVDEKIHEQRNTISASREKKSNIPYSQTSSQDKGAYFPVKSPLRRKSSILGKSSRLGTKG